MLKIEEKWSNVSSTGSKAYTGTKLLWNFTYNGFIKQWGLLILKTSILIGITTFKVCMKTQIFHVRHLYTRHTFKKISPLVFTMKYNQVVWKYSTRRWKCFEKYVICPSVTQKTWVVIQHMWVCQLWKSENSAPD